MMLNRPQVIDREIDVSQYPLTPDDRSRKPAQTSTEFITAPTARRIEPAKRRSAWPELLSAVFLGASLFLLSTQKALLLGQLSAIVITPLVLLGLLRGGIRKGFWLFGFILAVYAAAVLPPYLTPLLSSVAGSSASGAASLLSIVIAFVGFLATGLIGRAIRKKLVQRPGFSMLDRGLGMAIGLAEGLFVVLSFCWTCMLLEPHAERLRNHAGLPLDSLQHQVAGNMIRLSREVSNGSMGEFLRTTNPINKVPSLRDAIQGLNETGHLDLSSLDPQVLEILRKAMQSNVDRPTSNMDQLLDQQIELPSR